MVTHAKVVSVTTNLSGVASAEIRLYGKIVGLGIRLGTLSTPDITIVDGLSGAPVYAAAGIATDKRIQPRVLVQDDDGADIAATYDAPVITGLLEIDVTGGGATKSGEIVIVFE